MGNFSVLGWIITAAIIYAIYSAIKGLFCGGGRISKTGSIVCPSCGTRGEPKTITRGSTLIELVLWLCLIVPGLIYSIWRLTTRQEGCPACGAIGVIPADTPNGRKIVKNSE